MKLTHFPFLILNPHSHLKSSSNSSPKQYSQSNLIADSNYLLVYSPDEAHLKKQGLMPLGHY